MSKIILASASPRRRELLTQIGLKFEIIPSHKEERMQGNSPAQVVMGLSMDKAEDIFTQIGGVEKPDALVIGADTIVALDNMILGKPKDETEAYNMIKLLSGKTHYVITGFALINLSLNKKIVDCQISQVTFKELSEATIKDYIQTKESLDKAGAYGIQGYGGLLVKNIQGDYFNIVGLPISKISDCLKDHFDINLFYGG